MTQENLTLSLPSFNREALLEEAAVEATGLVSTLEGTAATAATTTSNVLRDLKTEAAQFGAKVVVVPLNTAELDAQGKLPPRTKGLLTKYDFYDVTVPVTLFPRRGWAFDRLECQVKFNPSEPPARQPLAHDVFPASEWDTLARFNMHLEVGITEKLEFKTPKAELSNASAEARGKVDGGASFVFPPRDYAIKRAKIVSRGRDASEIFWRLDNAEYFEKDEPRLGVILQVPKGVRPVNATGVLVAYRSFRLWSATLGELMGYFSEKVRNFFQAGAPLTDTGNWNLTGDL